MSAFRFLAASAISALAFLFPIVASAMTVSPMQVEMTAVGSRATARVSVINNSSEPLPVEAVMARLTLDESGKQSTSKAGEEFLVMPPQAVIPPGATQNFRVQWLGDPMMSKSESFLLLINQVPVKLPAKSAGVQVVMGLGVMVNVAPATGNPAMKVVATGITTDKSGRRLPVITVENTSNVHALLPQASLQLAGGGWSSTLTPSALGDRIGIGLVQPGHRRKFTLPVELPAGVVKFEAKLDLAQRR